MTKFKDIKGKVFVNQITKDGIQYDFKEYPNMRVDDGTEYLLDFFCGRKSWHDPKDRSEYGTGQVGLWTTERWVGAGTCMFNNASAERVDGQDGIPDGSGLNYPIATTELVSVEDSFLSREVGSRVQATPTRVDQTVELYAEFSVPGDIPSGTEIREYGLFLSSSGPSGDPSALDARKPNAMLCRTVRHDTGIEGGTGYYTDDPLIATDTIQIRWKVGEV